MDFPDLAYLTWARGLYGRVEVDLGSSNAPTPPWSALGLDLPTTDLLTGDHGEGPPALLEAVASAYGVDPGEVFCAAGASGVFANVCRALLTPGRGDHVACEHPVYEPLAVLPASAGATVTFVRRPGPGGGGDLDPASVIDAIGPTTRMVVLSSLHNPSGRRLPSPALVAIADAASRHGATVVVDEVYLEYLGADATPAATLHPALLSINSTTKVLGLGALRVGWALCRDRGVIARLRRAFLHDAVNLPSPSVHLAVAALARRRDLIDRARTGLDAARAAVAAWAATRRDVAFHPPDGGHMAWLELVDARPGVTGRVVADRLLADTRTVIAPGDFFGDPGGLRIGYGRRPAVLAEGLTRLGRALDALR